MSIVYDITNEAYHSRMLSISNSGLNDFARSPAHYYALHLDPRRPARAVKAGQLEGTLAHCAILEPSEFSKRYVIGPDSRRGTKAWDAFEDAMMPGQVAIKTSQALEAQAQAESVRRHPEAGPLLNSGKAEVSAFWIDEETRVHCRCRPDWVHDTGSGVILLDVKTCGDASPKEFARQIARKGYHRQAAWYTDGYSKASGQEVLGFVFVAVESEWPYACSAVMLDDQSLERGRAENRELLTRFAECDRSNTWPAYGESIELVTLPSWAA